MKLTNSYSSLKNKTVIITGGADGIGASLVENFVAQGADVYFCDINVDSAEKLVEKLSNNVTFKQVDVTDIVALQNFIATVGDETGCIDVLINNASSDDRHSLTEITPEYWDNRLNINLRPHIFAIQKALQYMQKNGASVINMGSVSWIRKRGGMVGYTTAKGGINALTRTLAAELGTYNIRVNSVVPGAILTERQKKMWVTPELEKDFLDNQALKFRILPEDVVAMVLFLASDDSRACCGQNFIVDAGIV